MNTKRISSSFCLALLAAIIHGDSLGQGLTIPKNDAGIADSISNALPAPYTADELAAPPAGEIRKLRLRAVDAAKTSLQTSLTSVPLAEQNNPIYNIASSVLQKLELVSSNRQQNQLFGLIEDIVIFNEAAKAEGSPSLVKDVVEALNLIKASIVEEMAAYLIANNAVMSSDKLALFVNAFTKGSLLEDGDWEGKTIPVSGVELMIIDPVAVIAQIKSQPWRDAEQFLGRATATEAFAQYAESGTALAVLKTKFAANQASIIAKWNELAEWVEQQKAANP